MDQLVDTLAETITTSFISSMLSVEAGAASHSTEISLIPTMENHRMHISTSKSGNLSFGRAKLSVASTSSNHVHFRETRLILFLNQANSRTTILSPVR